MNVHIHRLHRKVQLQHARRKAPDHELILIRLLQRRREKLRFDKPGIDEKILIRAVAARAGGLGDKAAHRELIPVAVDLDHAVRQLPAEDGIDGAHAVAGAGSGELLGAVF